MAEEIMRFAEEQLKKGYTPVQVRSYLIAQGYSPALVEGVLESIQQRNVRMQNSQPSETKLNHSSIAKLIVGFTIACILIATGLFLPQMLKSQQALLDVIATPDANHYSQGDNVKFDVQIINMGSKERFDITLSYRILDEHDNLITSKEETIAISTTTSQRKSIGLPKTARPGLYNLKVFANYEEKIATSSFTFTIDPVDSQFQNDTKNATQKPATDDNKSDNGNDDQEDTTLKETCSDGKRNQDEKGIDCGGICGGYWYDLKCNESPKPTVPANTQTQQNTNNQNSPVITSKKSTGAMLLEIRLEAKENPDIAMQKCLEFEEESTRDKCLKDVASAGKRSDICELIISDTDRDTCYYPFFMQGDYTVCDKLVTLESLQTCAQLKQISAFSESNQ